MATPQLLAAIQTIEAYLSLAFLNNMSQFNSSMALLKYLRIALAILHCKCIEILFLTTMQLRGSSGHSVLYLAELRSHRWNQHEGAVLVRRSGCVYLVASDDIDLTEVDERIE